MLVGALPCAHCTRDRGCSAHPAFPAPSVFRGKRFSTTRALGCGIAEVCLMGSIAPHLPVSSPESGRSSIPETPVILPIGPGVLVPRFRGDDSGGWGCAIPVIARSSCDEAIHLSSRGEMDCFASLAM